MMRSESDIQKIEEYVYKKMLFNLVEQDEVYKYQKDSLNDKHNDIQILRIMQNFKYYNSKINCRFKDRFEIGKIIGQGSYAVVREGIDKIKY